MDSFLRKLARRIADKFDSPENLCIVLPTKRSVTFLKQELADVYQKTFWAPQFFSLDEFVASYCPQKKEDKLMLVLELYEAYLTVAKEDSEDLSSFLKWAPTLLSDFSDIDRYLIDPKNIFSYINQARALEYWNVNGEPLTDAQNNYLHFWQLLGEIYHAFQKKLLNKGIAYAGIQYRYVSKLINQIASEIKYSKIWFAGFNALSTSEEKIIYTLIKEGKAEIFWDADDYYLKSNAQEAGRFMRRILKKYPTIPFNWTGKNISKGIKKINIVTCNTDAAQTHYAGTILQESFNEKNAIRTAVVLNNEELLLPLLYNLPSNVNAANITMGYSLKLAPLTSFINAFFDCWSNYRGSIHQKAFYFKSVFQVIEHPCFSYLALDFKSKIQELKGDLVKKNVVYVGVKRFQKYFHQAPFIPLLFNEFDNPNGFSEVILKLLGLLKDGIQKAKLSDVEKSIQIEYLFSYTIIFRKFLRLLDTSKHLHNISIKIVKKLINQLVSTESISFFGEPLQGLQIMGMLETRLLDFDKIIMLSVNEGVLPKGKKENSFIPYDIKREFGLPTHHDHDAVFANHFYRLLQRGKQIDLVYLNGQNDFGASTEKSRFIEQILVELPLINPDVTIQEVSYTPSPELNKINLEFKKDEKSISAIVNKLEKGISPSALNNFISCSLDFYYRYILKLGEADEVEENLKNSTFGTCVHNTLELLFEPFLKKNILVRDLKLMDKKITSTLTRQFKDYLSKDDLMTGSNLLTFEVAKQYIKNFLELEIKNVLQAQNHKLDYRILSQENKINFIVPILIGAKKINVKIEGFADRIGVYGNQIQLVDYKTGSVSGYDLSFKSWNELADNPKKSKALQLALYGYIYLMQNPEVDDFISGIYSFRNLKSGLLQLKWNRKKVMAQDIRDNFPEVLKLVVSRMLDTSFVFKHNTEAKYCNYCC